MTVDRYVLDSALRRAREKLLAERVPAGHWTGELSSSPLSTATAVWALVMVEREKPSDSRSGLVRRGLDWLAQNQNEDGGWGDTVLSRSNLSTTVLVWSAFAASPGKIESHQKAVAGTEAYLACHADSLEPPQLAAAIRGRYGEDRTFSAPILTMAALAGRLGPSPAAWRHVAPLPFELAACPHRWLKWLHLPVVSYALPALIAVGQVRQHFRPSLNPVVRLLRSAVRRRTLDLLRDIQPPSGGFLEATPLTSFVVMSLVGAGHADHEVVRKGVEFLTASARADGSWPIDTNLATWVTTLSVSALAASPTFTDDLPPADRAAIRDWLLAQQHLEEHPYTRAAPGGWAWTDLAGGVPDADDTAGALVALRHLGLADNRVHQAAARGAAWLMGLQNSDGGIPTFCRGWGALPFDRSSPDLTAHALAAWTLWLEELPPDARPQVQKAIADALNYLEFTQSDDGSWTPLWFGNQWAPREENPTYGTARVVSALLECDRRGVRSDPRTPRAGIEWLLEAQNWGGAWGGSPAARSSIEETALAVDALARALEWGDASLPLASIRLAISRGTEWLLRHTDDGTRFDAAPIGLYFAKLWYCERLYPLIFTVAALERVRQVEISDPQAG